MSGDVQPRKRKDKRRKKGQVEARRSEEYAEERSFFGKLQSQQSKDEMTEEILPPTKNSSDEIIHVHKDIGLGGNVVTKLIFFALLMGLGVMVGIIFTEYRGRSDEESKSAIDSPWSLMLEGWVENTDAHDDHHGGGLHHISHSEEHAEEEEEEEHGGGHEEEEEHDEHEEEGHGGEEEGGGGGWLSMFYGGGGGEGKEETEEDEPKEKEEGGGSWFGWGGGEKAEEAEGEEEKESGGGISSWWGGSGKTDEVEGQEEETKSSDDEESQGLFASWFGGGTAEPEALSSVEEEQEEEGEEEEEEELGKLMLSEEEQEEEEAESRELEESVEEGIEELSEEVENDIPVKLNKVPERKSQKVEDVSDEELFPEAIAALQQEQEEIEIDQEAAAEEAEEEEQEAPVDEEGEPIPEEETSGKSKEPQTETIERVEIVDAPTKQPPPKPQPVQEVVQEKKVAPQQATQPPAKAPSDEESEDESEIDLTDKKYQEILARYGQPATPESSDVEPSDEEAPGKEYSEGEDESVGEEESGGEMEGSEPEEEELPVRPAVTTKQNVPSESEDEEEEEEEESEDEIPVLTPRRPQGGPKSEEDYMYGDTTNEDDWLLREQLDDADNDINNARYKDAQSKFEGVLKSWPESARGRYGKALALDKEAEVERSNTLLVEAIQAYLHALSAPKLKDALFLKIALRVIDRMRFKGLHLKAVAVHNQLIERFKEEPKHRNNLAITYLMINRLDEAGRVLRKVLDKWPNNGMALAHYGLVLKLQGKHKECVPFLEEGLAVDVPENKDARLYFHLGDALSRLNRYKDAMKVYEKGVEKGLFRSKYQRSLYNVDRLTARPWWTHAQTTYQAFFKKLEENWKVIRDEGVAALKSLGAFQDEAENLRDVGDWKQFELYARGMKYKKNCLKTPVTCGLIASMESAHSCSRGQSKYSVMYGGTHVWPHCGPTNTRIRAHLGLIVPSGTSIRVAEETRTWEEGKVLVFDDSFEHEVWHNGTSLRLVLIVDLWHPELTRQERRTLSPI